MKNDNHVLAEFASAVRGAAANDFLRLPWHPTLTAGASHQAAIVALYENGLLGYKKGVFGSKFYCSNSTLPFFRIYGVLGSMLESIAVVVLLLTILSFGTRLTDFLGLCIASAIFLMLVCRGLATNRYLPLYDLVVMGLDRRGRVRNGLMFLCSFFALAMAAYFYRRIFVHDAYAQGSLSLLEGGVRALSDGLWYRVIFEEFMGLTSQLTSWWQYPSALLLHAVMYSVPAWLLLWSVALVVVSEDAIRQVLTSSGMLAKFDAAKGLEWGAGGGAASTIAVYSSLIAAFVFFFTLSYYEDLAVSIF